MSKILFMDIDGCLNRFSGSIGAERGPWIKPECLARLDRIVSETDANVVVSSSWRKFVHNGYFTLEGLKVLLKSHGMAFAHHVVDVTPDGALADRGAQCRAWHRAWPHGSSPSTTWSWATRSAASRSSRPTAGSGSPTRTRTGRSRSSMAGGRHHDPMA